jgi:hypothetical protein
VYASFKKDSEMGMLSAWRAGMEVIDVRFLEDYPMSEGLYSAMIKQVNNRQWLEENNNNNNDDGGGSGQTSISPPLPPSQYNAAVEVLENAAAAAEDDDDDDGGVEISTTSVVRSPDAYLENRENYEVVGDYDIKLYSNYRLLSDGFVEEDLENKNNKVCANTHTHTLD